MNPRLQARIARGLACLAVASGLAACNNSPDPDGAAATNTLFYSFDERSPRYLDPTASYANPESAYTYQIYEPLYGYHYLKRPYELVPKAAAQVAKPYSLDTAGQRLEEAGPSGAAFEFGLGAEKRQEAGRANEVARPLFPVEGARERSLRGPLEQDRVPIGGQNLLPLRLGLLQRLESLHRLRHRPLLRSDARRQEEEGEGPPPRRQRVLRG